MKNTMETIGNVQASEAHWTGLLLAAGLDSEVNTWEILKQTLVHRYIMNIFMIHISICTQKILEKQLYLCRRGLKAVARAKHISGTRIMSITKGTQQYQNSHCTLVDVCPPWLGALRRSFERAEGIWVMHIEPHACFKYTPVNQHSNGSNGKWTIWLVDLFYIE